MSQPKALDQWCETVVNPMDHLSLPQTVLKTVVY